MPVHTDVGIERPESTVILAPVAGSLRTAIDSVATREWVSEKIGHNNDLLLRHVLKQVAEMDLRKNDGLIEILRGALRLQARDAAIHGEFSSLVDKRMPIEVKTQQTGVSKHFDPDGMQAYERWRSEREKVALELIDEGIELLQSFAFNDFWDANLWDRLRYTYSRNVLMEDGIALLEVIFNDMPETEHEIAIATALADRFAEDIVKAEIREDNQLLVGQERLDAPSDSRSKELDELKAILSMFLMAAEGVNRMKLYEDTLPLSFSWCRRLVKEVAQGNDQLLADLREIKNDCARAIQDDTRHIANEAMARVLAKHFPSIIISELSLATEIVLRSYQMEDEEDGQSSDPSALLNWLQLT